MTLEQRLRLAKLKRAAKDKEKRDITKAYNKRRNDIWENQLMKQWEML